MKLEISRYDLLQLLSQHCRGLYIMHRQMYEVRRTGFNNYRMHPKWDGINGRKPIWPRVAQYFLDNKLDAEICIGLRFIYSSGRFPPAPNQLMGERFLESYTAACRQSADELQCSLGTQKQIFKNEVVDAAPDNTGRDAWEYVLLNDGLDLSPLFRTCLGIAEELPVVVDEYLGTAVLQYIVDMKAYDIAWGKWILPEFRREVRSICNKTVTQRTTNAS